ncbi:MAG: oligoendopeptidase F, partial [Deltaproteobacteria bacterium]
MSGSIKKRDEIAPEFKWKLEDIYSDEAGWEADFEKVKTLSAEVEKYQGKIGDSAEDMLALFKLSEQLERLSETLYVYARMRRDENNANARYQTMVDRIETLGV